ncbi:MAG TPA: hypothetical protein DCS43_13410 [Verrucomicrobia bacterium]|nr:hypothetical protein [Verrucomicrobiota bacterium]
MMVIPDMFLMMPVAASTLSLMLKSDATGYVIMGILFLGSIYVWALMFSKWFYLKACKRECLAFLRRYRILEHPAALFLDKRHTQASPLQAIYDQSCTALEAVLNVQGTSASRLQAEDGGLAKITLSDRQIHSVQSAAERTVAEQALLLEANMSYLASASSAAPFLGLLGTVLGVMTAFGSMTGSGSALLSEVAPGIAGALGTTVVGLFVALPSSLGYNALSDKVRQLTVMMDNFSQELVGDLERVHGA